MASELAGLNSADPAAIEKRVIERVQHACECLAADGKLPSREQLNAGYARFAERFGPAALKARDGTVLLEHMHDHGNRGSLAFWLEFKDDEELPGVFGSISGGSALKFGIYRRKESGVWMTGHPQDQRALSVDEAVNIARRNRDQLAAAVGILASASGSFGDTAYAAIQRRLLEEAPDVANTAWGHKYLHMLAPSRLDNYHIVEYQRFHLLKLLQPPPVTEGRYAAGGRYAALATRLGFPMVHLTQCFNELHGRPYRYWRIGTSDGDTPRKHWSMMCDGGVVAIGWPAIGDLSSLPHEEESRAEIKRRLNQHYPKDPRAMGRTAQQIFNFLTAIQEGHLVLASDGGTVLGIGRIKGPYQYVASAQFPHQRSVEWIDRGEWKMLDPEGLQTAVHEVRHNPKNLLAVERRLLAPATPPLVLRHVQQVIPMQRIPALDKIPGELQRILDRKGQAVLYGPPGTGKTHWAEWTARNLASQWAFGRPFDALTEEEKERVGGPKGKPLVRMCCFHPSYGYEDFIEGHRPEASSAGSLSFKLRNGVFKALCKDAEADLDRRYYLIIDEINRGDIPRIFGELLTLLEPARRGSRSLILPLSGESLSVPPNVYVIGTMNTADRSIALIDVALRRRFGFVELLPEPAVLGSTTIEGIPLGPLLRLLNRRLIKHLDRDGRNLQIGHSFFLNGGHPITGVVQLRRVFLEDIIPLLEEYCYEDWQKLEQIIGNKLVDVAAQRIRRELFEESAQDQLVQALRGLDASLVTSREATTSTESEEKARGDEEEDEDTKDGTEDGA